MDNNKMKQKKLHLSLLQTEFSLDDIVFPPLKIPNFEWNQVDLTTKLTERIILKIPLISSPMDTVTGSKMAILLALQGGIGVIHYNFPTIEDQMREVEKVRRFETAFVRNPIVLDKNATIGMVFENASRYGFFSFPVTEDGTLETPLIGFVSRRDVRYQENMDLNIQKVMTPRHRLITAHKKDTLDKNDIRAANKIIRENNLDTLPIVDSRNRIIAIVTDSDLSKDKRYPLATKDTNKQLKVLVAVESRFEAAKERIKMASQAGACGIVVDARNIFKDHLQIAKWTKKEFPQLDVILGNIVTGKVVSLALTEAGKSIDAFRVGIGTGEVCTTTESLGIGRALGSALYEIDSVIKKFKFGHVGIIADGGIKTPRHIIGALTLGANAVMLGSMLAGLEESPILADYDSERDRLVKRVRGMGSPEAIRERAGSNRYMVSQNLISNRFPEGVAKTIPYRGSGEEYILMLITGIRQAMHGLGHCNLRELYDDGYILPAKKAASKGIL